MLKFYVFLYNLLNEVTINLIVTEFKLSKEKVFNGLSYVMLTKAEREARRLNENDFWLLMHLGKEMTAEKYRANPWTYEETLENKICSEEYTSGQLKVRLRYFERWEIAEKGESNTNKKSMWRLTEYGQKVSKAFQYMNWKCPQLHQQIPTPPS